MLEISAESLLEQRDENERSLASISLAVAEAVKMLLSTARTGPAVPPKDLFTAYGLCWSDACPHVDGDMLI